MADLFLDIQVDDTEAQNYFTYAGYRARDMRIPLSRVLLEVVLPGVEEQFESEGGRSGGWKPLDDKYLGDKINDGFPPDILIRTGEMRRKFLGLDGGPKPWRITHDTLDYFVDDPKATLHQQGGWVAGRPPQREIVVLTPDDYAGIEHIFAEWLDDLRVTNARRGMPDPSSRPSGPSNIWVL